jgi:phage terminase large subunit-like protein
MKITEDSLEQWRQAPDKFIECHLINPQTNKPFVLLDAEKDFLKHALRLTPDGRLLYHELLYGCPKKSGKTEFSGMLMTTILLLFGGRYAEAYVVANDLEQAQARVFEAVRRVVEASPLLRREAKITQNKITFPATGATITCLTGNYASAAGGHPTISVFDEAWAYTSERSRRLYDELVPVPTTQISCRLITTYAGFEGEGQMLHELYLRGMQQPELGPNLRGGDGLLMAWHHTPIAPWQTPEWMEECRRSLRPNQYLRMIENRFVSSESNFIELSAWDRCVNKSITPISTDRSMPVYVGVDASHKHDSTAIVATHYDKKTQQVRLVWHRIFQPSPEQPLDFEQTIERTLHELNKRFLVRGIWYDPWQMQASAQRLTKERLRLEELPQSPSNLTSISQNLFDLIQSQSLMLYADAEMRTAAARTVAIEMPRGWRIGKDKQTHKIDVIVALAMSAWAAVQGAGKPVYILEAMGDDQDLEAANKAWQAAQLWGHIMRNA